MVWPAWANAPSISPATEESSPENTSCGARPGVAASTDPVRHIVRQRPGRRQAAASRYALPSERWLAPSQVDAEPRMVREQRDELLADHPGRAKNADFELWA